VLNVLEYALEITENRVEVIFFLHWDVCKFTVGTVGKTVRGHASKGTNVFAGNP